MDPAETDLLAGRYQRVRSLGSGGMGDVWLADDLDLGRLVAVKRLRFGTPAGLDAELVERMLREARVVARLNHPAIVTLHDLVRVEGRPHLIMQYVDGESLGDRIVRERQVDWRAAARVIADVAGGLAAAHKAGVLHRDVKPANLLIDSDGRGHLADFGIARGDDDAAITRAGEMVGTVAYMPPEVARDNAATMASDVWSLGATFFAATEGTAPFAGSGSSVPAILQRLVNDPAPAPAHAGGCTAIINRMLASDPAARPTAAQVADQIQALLSSPALPVPPPAPATEEAIEVLAPPTYHAGGPPSPPPAPGPTSSYPGPTQIGAPTPVPAPGSGRSGNGKRVAAVVGALVLLVGAIVGVVLLQGGGDDGPDEAQSSGAEPGSGSTEPSAMPGGGFTVPVGVGPRRLELGIDDPAAPLYVANTGSSTVTVIDPADGTPTTIDVCQEPTSIAVTRDGSQAFVGCRSGFVSIIDATSETGQIDLQGLEPGPLLVDDNGGTVYVPLSNGFVNVYNLTGDFTTEISIGTEPGLVHLTPDNLYVYTPDPQSGIVARISTSDFSAVPIEMAASPNGLQISDNGERAYVTLDDGRVQSIGRSQDDEPDIVNEPFELPGPTLGRLRLQPQSADVAWIPSPDDGAIWVVDGVSGTLVDTIDFPGEPGRIVNFNSTGTKAYLPDVEGGVVYEIDTESFELTPIEGAGENPTNLTVSPDDTTLYVVDLVNGEDGEARVIAVPLT